MFSKQKLIEIKEQREAKRSVNDRVEASLKAFYTSSNKLEFDYNNFLHNFIKGTVQTFHIAGRFDRFKKEKVKSLEVLVPSI